MEYNKKNNHCHVREAEDKKLCNWVYKQRLFYKHFNKGELNQCKSMSDDQIAKLKSWTLNNDADDSYS